MSRIFRYSAQMFGFFALWLLFVYQLSWFEVLAGIAAAALATFASEAALRSVPLCFKPRTKWLAQVWRLPSSIGKGIWALLRLLTNRVLRKPDASFFQIVPFRGVGADPEAGAQRALAVLYATIPPSSVAVGVERESGFILFHQIEQAPVPRFLLELES